MQKEKEFIYKHVLHADHESASSPNMIQKCSN